MIFFSNEVKKPPRWLRAAYVRWTRSFRYRTLRPIARFVVSPPSFGAFGTFYGIYLSTIVPLLFIVLGVVTFVELPRELGGPSPSCAQLDIDKTMLSTEAQQELIPEQADLTRSVVRTAPLDLMFEGGDSVLVRRRDHQAPKDRRVLAISSKLIRSTVDCE